MTSPLLRLPAELRNQIWEYVLCGNDIHIGVRRPHHGEDGVHHRQAGQPPVKLTHALCLCERKWDQAYQMSRTSGPDFDKNFDKHGYLKPGAVHSPAILRSYHTEHKDCNSVLHDFHWQDYMSFPHRACSCPYPCAHYLEYRRQTIDEFGAPPAGLAAKHRASRYNLALLKVCRQIHQEASLLPYSGNTFAFQSALDADLLLEKSLGPAQRAAIRKINLCVRALKSPALPRYVPENVKTLQCFVFNDDGEVESEGIEAWEHRFPNVQVISGWDGRRSTKEDARDMRRAKAAQLEDFFRQ